MRNKILNKPGEELNLILCLPKKLLSLIYLIRKDFMQKEKNIQLNKSYKVVEINNYKKLKVCLNFVIINNFNKNERGILKISIKILCYNKKLNGNFLK